MAQAQDWPPALGWPPQPLASAVVTLDRVTEADVPRIVGACRDPESQRWLPLPSPYGPAEAHGWLRAQREETAAGDGLTYAVRAAGESLLAGAISLHVGVRPPVAAIGYWIHPDRRGRGLAAAAVRLLAGHAFAAWAPHRVEIHVRPGNATSAAVARRAGAVYEGLRRAALPHHGRLLDCHVWAFVAADFARSPPPG